MEGGKIMFSSLPKLGVGFTYVNGKPDVMDKVKPYVDFMEITPDILCLEQVEGENRSFEYHPALLNETLDGIKGKPITVHGLGLSIGSTSGWNEEYLRILDLFYHYHPFIWHSEHLAFMFTTSLTGEVFHTGIPLPLPMTEESVQLVAPRAKALSKRYNTPFLLENFTYYLSGLPAEEGRDEVEFLNDLTTHSGCGLLLDLYNFYCNAINFNFDPYEALSRLHMDRVVEIHLAGSTSQGSIITDIHTDVVPEPVWQLLEWVAPRAVNLSGIVYEILDQAIHIIGANGIKEQLIRAHYVWEKYCTVSNYRGVYATK